MNRPKNPSENIKRERSQPSAKTREHERGDEFERSIPGKRTPEYVKQHDRTVNEDEQQKVVNVREDNAQSTPEPQRNETNESSGTAENQNDRLEAGDDNNEVNPRPRKVN